MFMSFPYLQIALLDQQAWTHLGPILHYWKLLGCFWTTYLHL